MQQARMEKHAAGHFVMSYPVKIYFPNKSFHVIQQTRWLILVQKFGLTFPSFADSSSSEAYERRIRTLSNAV